VSKLTPKDKRKARILALQVLYAIELNGSQLDDTYNLILDQLELPSNGILKYGKKLSKLVSNHILELDQLIKERSKNWNFSRITLMDKLILRMSLLEMIYISEVPPKVSIAEGVEIAKEFSTEDSSSFINGILDAVYNDIILNK
tara:strand:- start:1188 stop:1619 length:432 start_codon:yes stop_codon:yes gene_type:complete